MSTKLTRMCKISRMKVKWPDGSFKSKGVLDPGQEIVFTCKSLKPFSLSYDKYGLTNATGSVLSQAYDALVQTPLILVKKSGVLTHSDSEVANVNFVNTGFARIDYQTKCEFEVLANWQKNPKYLTFDQATIG